MVVAARNLNIGVTAAAAVGCVSLADGFTTRQPQRNLVTALIFFVFVSLQRPVGAVHEGADGCRGLELWLRDSVTSLREQPISQAGAIVGQR